jgi:multidrug efflux pump subunit AcrB
MQIYLDPSKPGLYGLTTNYIGGLLRSLVNGMKVSTFYFGEDEYDIVVRLPEEQRDDFELLNQLIITNDRGQRIPLDSLAELVPAGAPGTIKRVNYERVVTISGDIVEGYVESDVLSACRDTMNQLKSSISWTPGYDYEFTGEQQDQAEDMESLGNSFIMALFLILMILIAQFSAIRAPVIIMTSVFMSISGVLIYLMVFQQPFIIIMVGLGIISLAGVVVNNAIVLIDYIQKQRKEGYEVMEAVVRAGMIRLRPVLLTAFTTILALSPMALGVSLDFVGEFEIITDSFSAEFWRDFSSSVIFGLALASFLTLIIVPTLYYLFHQMQENLKKARRSKAMQKIKSIKNLIPKRTKEQDQQGSA